MAGEAGYMPVPRTMRFAPPNWAKNPSSLFITKGDVPINLIEQEKSGLSIFFWTSLGSSGRSEKGDAEGSCSLREALSILDPQSFRQGEYKTWRQPASFSPNPLKAPKRLIYGSTLFISINKGKK